MNQVVLVGCNELTARLPQALAGRGLELVVVGTPDSPLRHSRFVDHFLTLAAPFAAAAWASELLGHPSLARQCRPWILHASEPLMSALATADAPLERRLALLPMRRAEALAMVASKLGLAAMLHVHAIPTPLTRAVVAPQRLASCLAGFGGPLMIKADAGNSGEQVRRVSGPDALLAEPPPLHWYPLVLQSWVQGEDCNVEALFGNGVLLGLQASRPLRCSHRHGPNLSRRYLRQAPPGVEGALQVLGAAGGLHGLFSCTFRLPAAGGDPLLFEADARPNAWHAHGPGLGVDWGALMAPAQDPPEQALQPREPRHPLALGPEGAELHLFPRAPLHALATLSLPVALPWLLARPGTWDRRLRRDRVVNDWEWRQVRQAFRSFLRKLLWLPLRR